MGLTQIKSSSASGFNSGEYLVMYGTDISWDVSINNTVRPIPNTSTGSAFTSRIAQHNATGFQNPEIQLSFLIDLTQTHQTGALAVVDFEWLREIVNGSHVYLILKDELFRTTSNTNGELNVALQEVQVKRTNDSTKVDDSGNPIVGWVTKVVMKFVEVKV